MEAAKLSAYTDPLCEMVIGWASKPVVISELDRKTPVYVSAMSLKIWITACLVTTRPLPIHDRKPLLLSLELAREWINPETSSERAAEIAVGGVAGQQRIFIGTRMWAMFATRGQC